MDTNDLIDFYSGYFSDQNISEGGSEIASVFSQTQSTKDQLLEYLEHTEKMILNKDPAVMTIFKDTCLFESTGDSDRDWSQIDTIFSKIKDSIIADPLWV